MDRNYHKPRLEKYKDKTPKGKWYVVITKPESLRKSKNDKTLRRTTGTSDKRIAEMRVHGIAGDIYKEWDDLLRGDPLRELLRQHWSEEHYGSLDEMLSATDPLQVNEDDANMNKVFACYTACTKGTTTAVGEFNIVLADKLFKYLNPSEARAWRRMINAEDIEVSPYPVEIQQEQTNDALAQKAIANQKSGKVLNTSGAPKLSDCVQAYANSEKWNGIRNKTKNDTFSLIPNCINIIGDLPVDQVYRQHATQIARTLHEDGYSNSRIKTWLSSIRGLLEYVIDNELNHIVSPPKPWITSNSFYGFKAKAFGTKKRSWQPLTEEQLFELFALDMPQQDRLLLNILITTGMRLDEAALLEWEQYKEDRNGLRYFDLSLGSIVKNDKFSARTVAIPDVLQLPDVATGRLFQFKYDSDGKSSKDASRYLNESYVHKVRLNENDDRKVIHSLRHNLAGFMLNIKPTPSSEVMDWITGHGMEGSKTESERQRTYGQDPDVSVKYEIVNQIKHPWLSANK